MTAATTAEGVLGRPRLPAPTEAELQGLILDYARLRGWRRFHARPSRTTSGWVTPVAGDGAGFPDLVLCRGQRLVFAELKSATGRLTRDQRRWLVALRSTGADVRVWRPCDWPEIEETLR